MHRVAGARLDSLDSTLGELAGDVKALKGRLDGVIAAAVGIGVMIVMLAVVIMIAVVADTFGN
ncbi:MAG: hypothetical protein F4Z08_02385 [Chloroflexi bacterium]|nr:hypothetical protein [Chloroflexota bacterium]